ncbi:MAG: hypothetical protein JXB34_06490 [Bacteroidales bacterium]|nr:hypothetical protein [Bacteroidales bacterium]
MKNIKQWMVLAFVMSALIFTGCDEELSNPTFDDNAVPRIFGWYNTLTTQEGDTVTINPQVSPADNAIFAWYVDSVKVSEELDFSYVFNMDNNNSILRFEVTRNGVKNYREASVVVLSDFKPKAYNKKMVGFITRDGSIDDIDLNNLTHLVISSAVVGEVEGRESLADTTFTNLDIPLLAKVAHNAGVYVLLDVTGDIINLNGGGYYANYGFFNVISDAGKQAKAMETVVKFCADNDLDGINIYLNNTSEGYLDPDIVSAFFSSIPSYLPEETPRGKFFYTASVPGGWTTGVLSAIATVPEIDWVNLHAFRYEDLTATAHSPLWALSGLVDSWTGFGMPKDKIVGGFPAFGLHYFLPEDLSTVTWGNLWQYTAYESYKNILTRDAEAHNKNVLPVDDGIFYDGLNEVEQKAQYVIDQDLGGLMIWSLESDTRTEGKSLLAKAYKALGN